MTDLTLAYALNMPLRRAATNAQAALASERASHALARAHIAALRAVLQRVTEQHPDAVQGAIDNQFLPAFYRRASELGAAELLLGGTRKVQQYAVEARARDSRRMPT